MEEFECYSNGSEFYCTRDFQKTGAYVAHLSPNKADNGQK